MGHVDVRGSARNDLSFNMNGSGGIHATNDNPFVKNGPFQGWAETISITIFFKSRNPVTSGKKLHGSFSIETNGETQSLITFRVVREDEEVDAGRPSSGTEDGDPLWVSSEVADVLVEPAQGLNLVQQAVVPLSRLVAGTEEA